MKQHHVSKGAECRHPVRRRHGAFLAMYEAQATKQLSSAIVISSSRFALFCFFRASSLSKAPAAAAVDHAAAAITPTERQGRVCRCVCREHSDFHRRRRPSCSRVIISARNVSQRPSLPKAFLQSTVQLLICVWVSVGEAAKRRSTGRHISTARGTAGWQRCMRYGHNLNNHARWQHTHIHKKKKNKKKSKQHGGRVWLCVCGAAGVCPPWPQENKTRGKEMCAPPHRPSSHAHTSRLPQRAVRRGPSSCVQQARRTGPSS
ncbi:hypothetical protein ECC02_009358 [Trypanosoma cruzi]|uniref:Uncharacterized protein n=1 Tax=Trypanosoma cruzi TaxID=5693 RepID=A0A7J6XU23_TRYCR|nr:hypothetical protein ECC02_012770 [Trypanosoma cruzi]KAF5217725.1 hypothetical protein ECC02_009358 [Trypanosoma cruzi]